MISKYFKHVSAKNEQDLMQALTAETIFQRGLDLYYIPRISSDTGFDYLFGEDPENKFDEAVQIEMSCEEISSGFDGSAAIGRFALELGDTATFSVATSRFKEEMKKKYPDITRPREGDLIVFLTDPTEDKYIFEITFTERSVPFYQMGKSNLFRMEVERFNYSHEDMDTGVDFIDNADMNIENEVKDNTPIQEESDTFMDFNEADPFSEDKKY